VNPAPGPGFERLLQRLVRRVGGLLSNGEYTERGLARLTGISQPHLHHILAGKRTLTPPVADSFLVNLGWTVGELFKEDEVDQILLSRRIGRENRRRIPVLSGKIGPGSPWPDTGKVEEWLTVRSLAWPGAHRLFLAELEPDAAVPFARSGGQFALVAEDEGLRARVEEDCWHVLRWGGAGLVRRVRREGACLKVLGQGLLGEGGGPQSFPLEGQSLLSVVRGRLLWAGPDPRKFDAFTHSGSGFPIATAS
jgi:hypothetical protein